MDKVKIICMKDREMMEEFSSRSIRAIDRKRLPRAVTFFSAYLEGNVRKEVDKDSLIIRAAASAFNEGRPACDLDLEEIFERTKTIDKAFLEGLLIPSFTLSIRYSDIADIRIRRIWRIARMVYALLRNWADATSFSDAVRGAYRANEFTENIVMILHLYTLETRMLGDAIRSPFHRSIANYLENLYRAMDSVMHELTAAYARKIYGDEPAYGENRPDPAASSECL